MKKLYKNLSLTELHDLVKNKKKVEFEATSKELNLEEIKDFYEETTIFKLPPLNPPQELITMLFSGASSNLNYIFILAFLLKGEVIYRNIGNDTFQVSIKF